jgi:WD40 repeat protein/serine/threonine protein kinase
MQSKSAMVDHAAHRLESRTLGDFVIREEIGRGGFGMVYRAEQTSLGREAVIKLLRAPLRQAADMSERFLREARLASQLDHPYAAHVYAFGAEPDGLLWIAMELVRGTPLDRLLAAQGALPIERVVPLLERICEVVHTAHEQGIVHRDLKPANVMVISRAGRLLPKLLDFGIAKAISLVAAKEPPQPGESCAIASVDPGALAVDVTLEASETPPAWSAVPRSSTPMVGSSSLRTDAITGRGSMIGSPPYMAPEQWLDATAATARSDLYSLGILTYEILTGHVPFQAKNLMALAREHAQATPPSLGPSFRPALDAVIAKALAKSPADRHGSVLELAQDVRAAAGLDRSSGDEIVEDDPVLEAFIREAPEPIAEAALAVVAARHPFQARDAYVLLATVALRWIGTMAVACRSRLGASPEGDSVRARELLRALRRRVLEPLEWLELARELVRAYRDRAEAYPLPWLVGMASSPDVEAAATEVLAVARAKGAADMQRVRSDVIVARPALAQLVAAVRAMIDTPMVVISDGRAESRMGAARSRRTRLAVQGALPADGSIALLDADGAPVVLLSPVVQVGAPAPGQPDEIFVLAGAESGAAGRARLVSATGAERYDDAVWSWLGSTVIDSVTGEASDGGDDVRTPYPGLTSFTARDADVFFGRESEVERVLNRVRVEPLVAIVGASGVGKSSFVAAGLVPAFPASWRTISFRPGASPLAAMSAALGRALGGDYRGAGTLVSTDVHEFVARARAEAALDGRTLVIIVDQLEELFTLCRDASERDRFGEALAAAARTAEDRLRVVLTLRDDFLARANEVSGLRERMSRAVELLSIPDRASLLRIVTAPAERVGYTFDDDTLPRRIVDDVADAPGALALLAFTVGALWERRDRHFHRLLASAYQELGGVGGALAKHADHVLAQLSAGDQRVVRDAFRQLVTSDGTRAVLTQDELRRSLGGGTRVDDVVERLIAARLLVTTETDDGAVQVEIVHEALLVAWPRLVAWRHEDAEGARLRDQLRAAAKQWDDRGRPAGLLWRDEALAEYQLWRAKHPGPLGAREEAFAAASVLQAARSRRRRRASVVAAFAALTVGLATVGVFYQRARAAKARTSERAEQVTLTHAEVMLDRDPTATLAWLKRYNGADSSRAWLLSADAESRGFAHHVRTVPPVTYVFAFSPDAFLTTHADRTLRQWRVSTGLSSEVRSSDLDDYGTFAVAQGQGQVAYVTRGGEIVVTSAAGGQPKVLGRPDAAVQALAFSPDGQLVYSSGSDGYIRTWGAAGELAAWQSGPPGRGVVALAAGIEGAALAACSSDEQLLIVSADGNLRSVGRCSTANPFVVMSSDGKRLAVPMPGGGVLMWDADSDESRTLAAEQGEIDRLAFSPRARRLVTASRSGQISIWDDPYDAPTITFSYGTSVFSVAMHPDGDLIAAGGAAGDVLVGRVSSAASWRLRGQRVVYDLTFTPDGKRIVSGGSTDLRIWPLPRLPRSLERDDGAFNVAFSRDSRQVAVDSVTGAPVVWNLDSGLVTTGKDRRPPPTGVAFSPDGSLLASTSGEGTLTIVRTSDGASWRELRGHEGAVFRATFSPDGSLVATPGTDGTVRVWRIDVGDHRILRGHEGAVGGVAFSPDGRALVSAGSDGTARVWDLPSGTAIVLRHGKGVVTRAIFDPGGTHVVTSGSDGRVVIWDATRGIANEFVPHETAVYHVVFSADGRWLASSARDGTVQIYDVATRALAQRLAAHQGIAARVGFTPAADRVVSAGADGAIRVWQMDGAALATLPGVAPVADMAVSSANDRVVVIDKGGKVSLWDLEGLPAIPRDPAARRAWLDAATSAVADGRTLESPELATVR